MCHHAECPTAKAGVTGAVHREGSVQPLAEDMHSIHVTTACIDRLFIFILRLRRKNLQTTGQLPSLVSIIPKQQLEPFGGAPPTGEARTVQQPQRHSGAGTLACGLASAHGSRPRCSTSQPGTCMRKAGGAGHESMSHGRQASHHPMGRAEAA